MIYLDSKNFKRTGEQEVCRKDMKNKTFTKSKHVNNIHAITGENYNKLSMFCMNYLYIYTSTKKIYFQNN